MERVHYRRVTPSYGAAPAERRRPAAPPDTEPSGFRERIIIQGIVSGVMLAVILALCLLNSQWTAQARAGLEQALDGHTTLEGLANSAREWGQTYLPFAFGPPEAADYPAVEPPVTDSAADIPVLTEPVPGEPYTPVNRIPENVFSEYIDEEVLAELNASKSTAPETPAAPGP
jgi:hypothetical protein